MKLLAGHKAEVAAGSRRGNPGIERELVGPPKPPGLEPRPPAQFAPGRRQKGEEC